MPKIPYNYLDNTQNTDVDKNFLQKRISSAKWLLQGKVDKENIIPLNLNTNTIKDFPSDVTAFDNSMKFFVNKTEGQNNEYTNPYKDLFLELVKLYKASPDVAVVGGTLDSEMSATFSIEKKEAEDGNVLASDSVLVKKEIEIPPNYTPMIWGELADLMIANGYVPPLISLASNGDLIVENVEDVAERGNQEAINILASDNSKKEYILKRFRRDEKEYVETMNYFRDGNYVSIGVNVTKGSSDKGEIWGQDVEEVVIQTNCDFPKADFDSKTNNINYSAHIDFAVNLKRIEPKDAVNKELEYLKDEGFSSVKLIPEILCRVM